MLRALLRGLDCPCLRTETSLPMGLHSQCCVLNLSPALSCDTSQGGENRPESARFADERTDLGQPPG